MLKKKRLSTLITIFLSHPIGNQLERAGSHQSDSSGYVEESGKECTERPEIDNTQKECTKKTEINNSGTERTQPTKGAFSKFFSKVW